jgi:hypothetical protein
MQERRGVNMAQPICRVAANDSEGVVEALSIQATGFAGGI